MTFNWDWQGLLVIIVPAIFNWFLGAIGVGVPKLTPTRRFNTTGTNNLG